MQVSTYYYPVDTVMPRAGRQRQRSERWTWSKYRQAAQGDNPVTVTPDAAPPPPPFGPGFISTTMASPPPPPPQSYSDFEFAFDPALQNYYPPHPPPPANVSADPDPNQLFSQTEQANLLGFLDNFQDPAGPSTSNIGRPPPFSSAELEYPPPPESSMRRDSASSYMDTSPDFGYSPTSPNQAGPSSSRSTRPLPTRSGSSNIPTSPTQSLLKPSLTTPQKRINHIMSEQKRRNAIREGYSTLITILAPEDGGAAIEMPTRGRPKGSGARNRGRTRGKSGILFRAVEYCKWLDEGNVALQEECENVERAAGLMPP